MLSFRDGLGFSARKVTVNFVADLDCNIFPLLRLGGLDEVDETLLNLWPLARRRRTQLYASIAPKRLQPRNKFILRS